MAKQPSYQPKVNTKLEGQCFKDTKPAKVDPKKEQFAPTDAAPMRARFKMAGGCQLLLLELVRKFSIPSPNSPDVDPESRNIS